MPLVGSESLRHESRRLTTVEQSELLEALLVNRRVSVAMCELKQRI